MAKTIKEKQETLNARERELRDELDLNSDGLKEKAKQVGKIALVSGGVALLGFWIYKAFFEDEDKPSKKSKKRKKTVRGLSSKLTGAAMPFVGKILDSIFSDGTVEEKEKTNKN